MRGLEREQRAAGLPAVPAGRRRQHHRLHPARADRPHRRADPAALAAADSRRSSARSIRRCRSPTSRTMTDVVERDTASRAAQVRVLGAFAVIAFVLAGIGIHGLLSFAVSQRAQEIGVRMALGAQSGDILRDGGAPERRCWSRAGRRPRHRARLCRGPSMEALLAGVKPADAADAAAAVGRSCVADDPGRQPDADAARAARRSDYGDARRVARRRPDASPLSRQRDRRRRVDAELLVVGELDDGGAPHHRDESDPSAD